MNPLTSTEIAAAASAVLLEGGYKAISKLPEEVAPPSGARFFEDTCGVVEFIVFETWEALRENWSDAQASLVELISRFVQSGEAKAWEGYLVLFTPAALPTKARADAEEIRYNTSRVRKLLATGEDLRTITDVERTLLPLLPLTGPIERHGNQEDRVLDRLPKILKRRGISGEISRELIDAFLNNEPLLERIHKIRS